MNNFYTCLPPSAFVLKNLEKEKTQMSTIEIIKKLNSIL
ncbi:hypothetical protein SAMN06296427_11291 [Moheibacter sediminis]|uniref:Uncharacterized protein n=1 Tax=Moheibacter sediminis TaxID=1434700 RepID=A0A1W2CZD8_9FLAO|nr:hypothetical protein SAMN06296427_11291 [Moheibacter sediminis]